MSGAARYLRAGAALLLGAAITAAAVAAPPRDETGAAGSAAAERPRGTHKPTGPIAVTHELAATPALGQLLEVTVSATAGAGALGLSLAARAADPDALLLAAQSAGVERDGRTVWVVTVMPLAPSSYLNLVVTAELDGVPQARSLVIPVRVPGADAPASAAATSAEADADAAEAVISLPAEERP
jgi:hypothetical protein